ncbi:MAG: peptide deformylase [Alphaproteobacteria bacterium]
MAILKIARMGHPVLKQRAAEVEDPSAPVIRAVVRNMIETLEDAEGAGLAAPQVHIPLRVVIFQIAPARASEEGDEDEGVALSVLVNPTVEPLSDEMASGIEACLSIPGMAGLVPRHTHIRYGFQTLEGNTVEREARDFHARVVQHECDHLDGILYPMRIPDLTRFGFVEEFSRAERQRTEQADA